MVQVVGYANSNASGEIAADAWERSDLAQVASGCELALNMVGLTTGAAVSRGGFWRRGAPADEAIPQRFFPWSRSDGEGLVLEFTELAARVWTARGALIETSPGSGTPYVFAQPYSSANLPGLRLKQVGDLGFITSRDGLLNLVVERLGDANWAVTTLAVKNGPWLAENLDTTRTLTFTDNLDGTWTVDASFAKFVAADAPSGQLLARPPGGGPGLLTWAPNTVKAADAQVISVGRIYATSGGGTTGNTPPDHDQGTVSDGGVDWTFLHDGATAVVIDSFVSATQVIVTPQGALPFATGTVTPNWSDLALGAVHGFPTALPAVREERLAFAGSRDRPDTIEFTRTAGFTPAYADFKPGLGTGLVVDDDGCRVQLGDTRARVVWVDDALACIAGTTEAEWVISGATLDDPITPAGIKGRRVSSYGSADVMPVKVQGPPSILLHVARGRTTLRELILGDGGTSGLGQGRDLSILAQHVYSAGVAEMAWSRPDNHVWLRLDDGGLACLTYHYEHGVIGVRRQRIGDGSWTVETLACAQDPDGRDLLHVGVTRVKEAATQRAHYVLATRGDVAGVGGEGVFLDGAQLYEGAPAATVAGLDHYEGEAVAVLADGGFVDGLVVSGGEISLAEEASRILVGQPLARSFKTLPFDPARDGRLSAARGRPSQVFVTLGCVHAIVRSEAQDEPDERIVPFETVLQRRPTDLVPVVRRKRQKVALGSGADRDVRVIVETSQPYDLQVFALRPSWEVGS